MGHTEILKVNLHLNKRHRERQREREKGTLKNHLLLNGFYSIDSYQLEIFSIFSILFYSISVSVCLKQNLC